MSPFYKRPVIAWHPAVGASISLAPDDAHSQSPVHLNPLHNEPASPTRPVNDRPTRPFPAPPRRRQFSASAVFDAPTSDTNPFSHTNLSHDHPQPPIHPDLRTGTVSSPTIVPAKPQPLPPSATPPLRPHHASNPFVARAAAATPTRSSPSPERKLPPLPPRKVPPVPPPRSLPAAVPQSSGAPPSKPQPPQLLTKVPHLTTTLMQQSLQASKAGQEAKRIEAQREQERVLQVLKSSSRGVSPPKRLGIDSGSSRSSLDGAVATIPVLPPRKRVSPPASVTSTRSFEQVAGASLVAPSSLRRSRSPLRSRSRTRSRSHSPSPSRPTTDLPPPVHPNRKPTLPEYASSSAPVGTSSPSPPRFGRSKSVNHHPSPPPVPRRRRPDSVQLPPSHDTTLSSHLPVIPHTTTSASTPSPTFPRLARHMSLSAREPLWDDMRDTLSAVRYKAEAGISRRGWVPRLENQERLIAERRESGGGPSASSSEDGLGVDTESLPDVGRRRGPSEWDEMKWPAGDGWKPLA